MRIIKEKGVYSTIDFFFLCWYNKKVLYVLSEIMLKIKGFIKKM